MQYEPEEVNNRELSRLSFDADSNFGDGPSLVLHTPARSLADYKQRLERRAQYDSPELAVGYGALDRASWGLRRGEIFTIAARPGVGKSSFCVNAALHLCRQGKKVLFLSTEMAFDAIFDRAISVSTQIPGQEFVTGRFQEASKDLMDRFLSLEWPKYQLFILDSFEPRIEQVEKALEEAKPDVLIFDHIQHISQGENANQEISAFTRGLKSLAQRHNLAVLMASQIRRLQDNRPPTISDLKGCGTLEEESAQVVLMYQTGNTLDENTPIVTFEMAKNRYGSMVTTELAFYGPTTTFREIGG